MTINMGLNHLIGQGKVSSIGHPSKTEVISRLEVLVEYATRVKYPNINVAEKLIKELNTWFNIQDPSELSCKFCFTYPKQINEVSLYASFTTLFIETILIANKIGINKETLTERILSVYQDKK